MPVINDIELVAHQIILLLEHHIHRLYFEALFANLSEALVDGLVARLASSDSSINSSICLFPILKILEKIRRNLLHRPIWQWRRKTYYRELISAFVFTMPRCPTCANVTTLSSRLGGIIIRWSLDMIPLLVAFNTSKMCLYSTRQEGNVPFFTRPAELGFHLWRLYCNLICCHGPWCRVNSHEAYVFFCLQKEVGSRLVRMSDT